MVRLLRQISVRQLSESWGRTVLVIGGIATGVCLMVAISIINATVLENFKRTIDLIAGPAALEVTFGVGEVGFEESTADMVRADADVAAAVPLVRGTISLAEDPGETLQLFGVDLTTEEDLERYPVTAVTDRRDLLRVMEDTRSVLLTTTFASRHRLGVGRRISLSTSSGVHDFTVRGLLEVKGPAAAFGGQLAVMDLPVAQLVLGKQGRVDQIDVILRPGSDTRTTAERLAHRLPDVLSVGRPAQRGEKYEHVLAAYQAMLTGLSTLCLVAGIFIIYNTTSTGAAHRALVVAGLRFIGADASKLFRLLMLEAFVLGAAGSGMGLALGVLIARLLVGMVADSMGINFQLRFPVEDLAIDPFRQIALGALGVAAALFASYFSARRITRLEPLDIMRADPGSTLIQKAPVRLVVWWVLLVAASASALFAEQYYKSIAWGNLGSTLWNASVIVIAIPLVSWLAAALTRTLPRLFRAEGRIAAESLFRSTIRTGVTVAAIALVLAVGITLATLSLSFRQTMNDYIGKFLSGDLVISAVTTEGGWLETPLPESVAQEVSSIPGVRAVESGRVVPGQLYRGQRIGLLALSDGMFDPARYPAGWYREGDPEVAARAVRAGEGVIASTTLADRLGLHVGDSIDLDTPSGRLILPIVGVVPDYVSDRGSILLSRRLLVDRWGERTVSRINVFLNPTAELDTIRERIARQFRGRYVLKILSLREVLDYHTGMINRALAFMDAIQLLIAAVTVSGILDLLLSSIVERRRELALWRLIGADDRAVHRCIAIESTTIGVLGAVLGAAVGFVTALIWVKINFRYLLGYDLTFQFPAVATGWYTVLVLLLTAAAGYGAALAATRQPVLLGIRNE